MRFSEFRVNAKNVPRKKIGGNGENLEAWKVDPLELWQFLYFRKIFEKIQKSDYFKCKVLMATLLLKNVKIYLSKRSTQICVCLVPCHCYSHTSSIISVDSHELEGGFS